MLITNCGLTVGGGAVGNSTDKANATDKAFTGELLSPREAQGALPSSANDSSLKSRMDTLASPDSGPSVRQRLEIAVQNNSLKYQALTSPALELQPAFFPHEGVLAVSRGGEVVAWPKIGAPGVLVGRASEQLDAAAVCKAGGLIAFADAQGVKIHALPLLQQSFQLRSVKTRVAALGFSPDCRSLLLGGSDGMVYRWKFAESSAELSYEAREKLLERYVGHASAVNSVVFHPFGRVFFSGDWGGVLNAWLRYDSDAFRGAYQDNLASGSFFTTGVQRMRGGKSDGDDVNNIRVSEDGRFVLAAFQSGSIELWKVRGFKRIAEIRAHKGLIYDVRFDSSGNRVVSAGRDGHVRSFSIASKPDPAGGPDIFELIATGDVLRPEVRALALLSSGEIVGATVTGSIVKVEVGKLPQ